LKILTVAGARPNFMKVAPLYVAWKRYPAVNPYLVHTGQHYDEQMSDLFFRQLGIPEPDVNLEVGSGSHGLQTARIIERLEPVMGEVQPDLVVVVGDVNSTMAGALVAAKLGIPVAHVEAGLRSFDRTMPEEINRVVTDVLADFLFASEPSGVENLLREGRPRDRIFLLGNIMIDSLKRFLPIARQSGILSEMGLNSGNASEQRKFAVLTLHRPATVDDETRLQHTLEAVAEAGQKLVVIFPVHPRTLQRIEKLAVSPLLTNRFPVPETGVVALPPLGYLEFLHLLSEATLVITDSGGIQEEATVLGVPCLTVRENTERPITITEGTNTLVGFDGNLLCAEATRILRGEGKRGRIPSLWDGNTAERICGVLGKFFPIGSYRD
jgi:UDP-N-acetylglucosamine 2-epimerase (non-hydrolysing)